MKTFEENQLIICDQLKEPVKYFPGICDHDGYVQIIGFGKIHIDNFTVYIKPTNRFKSNGDPLTVLEFLIEQNYEAVRARGLINDETDFYDFMEKLEEESEELAFANLNKECNEKTKKHFESELIDCISVLLNMAKHYKIDVIEGLKENIQKNQERAKNNQ